MLQMQLLRKPKPPRKGLHVAFVENEQWSVVRMKEEFHARFVAILQIFYHRKRLAYFSN
jgi:hypothetical protein